MRKIKDGFIDLEIEKKTEAKKGKVLIKCK